MVEPAIYGYSQLMASPMQNVRDEAERAYQLHLKTTGPRSAHALALYLRLLAVYNAGSPNSRPLQGYLDNGRTT
jgi:hypothetical protein